MAKRTPQQILDAMDAWDEDDVDAQIDAAIDAETERVLAMTPAQREAELRGAGVDVEAEKAKAREAHEKMQRGEAPAPAPAKGTGTAEPVATNGKGAPAGVVIPITRARSRVVRWGAGLAVAATVGGVYLANSAYFVGNVAHSRPRDAAARRHDAEEACARSEWNQCLKALDEADEADPAGANDPRERELRKAARTGLGLPEDGKPR
jgi:hypothetical protein